MERAIRNGHTEGAAAAPLDVIFLSYDEPAREENWRRVRRLLPWAQRVDGVEGLWRAHAECSRRARTENFFLIDGDAELVDDVDLDHSSFSDLESKIYLWRSVNAVNGLVSGCGGVKLVHRSTFTGDNDIDMTTDADTEFVSVPAIASISRFNGSPLTAWRGAFRECAKIAGRLLRNSDSPDRLRRLETWCTVGAEQPQGEWCLRGARAGRAFGAKHAGNRRVLELINDYHALGQLFARERRVARPA